MKVKLDRDDHFLWFIHNNEDFGKEIELSEAEHYWVTETFEELSKVQEFLREINKK